MAVSNEEQIERQFAELPMQIQLALLERLLHSVRTKIADDDRDFAADVAEMARDPDIIREVRAIDAEFRGCEQDGLNPV
jgi:hypothetical protein